MPDTDKEDMLSKDEGEKVRDVDKEGDDDIEGKERKVAIIASGLKCANRRIGEGGKRRSRETSSACWLVML